ncbi:MAG TPA: non-canonical purine NTP pyrophosphatase, partial [Chthoniobacterales bacterium]|nr:non-canonical purine NTP pyrophosphatase [Chthoniobacterales bacterium]
MDTNSQKEDVHGVRKLILATRNQHKVVEFRELLGGIYDIGDLSANPEIEMPEETGTTFEQNAVLKALHVSKSTKDFVIADDSGLEVDALNAAPGIYSARYAGKDAKDATNVDRLLRELSGVRQRSARFRCAIAIA